VVLAVLWGVAAWAAGPATAGAQGEPPGAVPFGAIRLELRQPALLPFSEGLLRDAVSARHPLAEGPASASAPAVIVRPAGVGWVAIETPARQQQLALAGRPAPEAARLVALAVLDVLRPALPPPAGGAGPGAEAGAGAIRQAARPIPRAGRAAVGVALLPGASLGFSGNAASFEPTLELTWWSARRWGPGRLGAAGALGFSRAVSRLRIRFDDPRFTLDTVPLRLGPRWGWRWLDLGGGAVVRAYRTAGLDGGRGATAGGFLSARAGLPLFGGLRAVAGVGADAVTRSLDFRAAGLSLMRTRHVIPWLGLGLAWEGPS
jgi:hypothetical protein